MHALARAPPSGRIPAQTPPPPPPPPSPVASAAAWELAIATPPFSAAALLCALATPLPVARALELAVASPPLAAVACALALATASSLRAAQRGEGGRREGGGAAVSEQQQLGAAAGAHRQVCARPPFRCTWPPSCPSLTLPSLTLDRRGLGRGHCQQQQHAQGLDGGGEAGSHGKGWW